MDRRIPAPLSHATTHPPSTVTARGRAPYPVLVPVTLDTQPRLPNLLEIHCGKQREKQQRGTGTGTGYGASPFAFLKFTIELRQYNLTPRVTLVSLY